MTTTGRTIRKRRGADELSTAADLHTRNSLLPTLDQVAERKLDRLTATPRRVELLAAVELHAQVVHLDCRTGTGVRALPHLKVGDDQLGRRGAVGKIDFRLLRHRSGPFRCSVLVCSVLVCSVLFSSVLFSKRQGCRRRRP